MKVGELYDMAKQYLPGLNTKEFTMFYNQALEKMSYDFNVAEVVETFTGSAVPLMPALATKILEVTYDDEILPRLMKR